MVSMASRVRARAHALAGGRSLDQTARLFVTNTATTSCERRQSACDGERLSSLASRKSSKRLVTRCLMTNSEPSSRLSYNAERSNHERRKKAQADHQGDRTKAAAAE